MFKLLMSVSYTAYSIERLCGKLQSDLASQSLCSSDRLCSPCDNAALKYVEAIAELLKYRIEVLDVTDETTLAIPFEFSGAVKRCLEGEGLSVSFKGSQSSFDQPVMVSISGYLTLREIRGSQLSMGPSGSEFFADFFVWPRRDGEVITRDGLVLREMLLIPRDIVSRLSISSNDTFSRQCRRWSLTLHYKEQAGLASDMVLPVYHHEAFDRVITLFERSHNVSIKEARVVDQDKRDKPLALDDSRSEESTIMGLPFSAIPPLDLFDVVLQQTEPKPVSAEPLLNAVDHVVEQVPAENVA